MPHIPGHRPLGILGPEPIPQGLLRLLMAQPDATRVGPEFPVATHRRGVDGVTRPLRLPERVPGQAAIGPAPGLLSRVGAQVQAMPRRMTEFGEAAKHGQGRWSMHAAENLLPGEQFSPYELAVVDSMAAAGTPDTPAGTVGRLGGEMAGEFTLAGDTQALQRVPGLLEEGSYFQALLEGASGIPIAGKLFAPLAAMGRLNRLENLSAAARSADAPAETTVRPREAEGIRGIPTAGEPGSGIKSVRELPLDEALAHARRGAHLVRKSDGKYVGAPEHIRSPQALAALRRQLDRLAEEGEMGRDWYDRTEEGNRRIAGESYARNEMLGAEEGLWSAQATPDTNLGFSLRGHNAYEFGAPHEIVRTGDASRRYTAARDAGVPPSLGPKTAIYGDHSNPFLESPITGTNDIWHARAFGYTGGKKGPGSPFDRGLTAQEHAFMDAETLLAAERLNAKHGTDIWDGRGTQAAIWVRMKGEDIAQGQSYGGDLQAGMAEANKTYPDYFDKYTMSATHEAVPGRDTGHLPDLLDTDFATREAYTDAVPWTTEAGNDAFYEALGMYSQPSLDALGYFMGDVNPMRVARPMVDRVGGKTPAAVFPESTTREVVAAAENLRGLLAGQNSAAFSQPIPNMQAGRSTSVFAPTAEVTPEMLRAASAEMPGHYAIDTGTGLLMLEDPAAYGARTLEETRKVSKQLGKDLKPPTELLGESVPGVPTYRVGADSEYIPILEGPYGYRPLQRAAVRAGVPAVRPKAELSAWATSPGSGVATRSLLDRVDALEGSAPNVPGRLSAEPLRVRAGLLADRDAALAATHGGVRQDLQNFRRIYAQGGLPAIRAALQSGVALPLFAGLSLGLGSTGRPQREGGR